MNQLITNTYYVLDFEHGTEDREKVISLLRRYIQSNRQVFQINPPVTVKYGMSHGGMYMEFLEHCTYIFMFFSVFACIYTQVLYSFVLIVLFFASANVLI